MQEPTSYAILLAGGKSQRMGQDKALLVYEGRTFLEHVIAALLPLTDNILVVADRADKYALPHGHIIVDLFPDTGPVGGILTGLMAAGSGAHWVVPCDMPAVSPDVLQLLRQAAVPPLDAVVPEINGELEPLYAVYRDTTAPKLRHYLDGGQRSARGALKTLNVRRIGEDVLRRVDPNTASFMNVNTPEELALLHQKRLNPENSP
jgi:molybdenum cofactor guanylyltransferase